jgi:oxygen-independent coproporphyrinogen-3 oxidase
VTVEANPETVEPGMLGALRAAGFTRISLGMQSARRHVLAALDRRHTPGRAVEAAAMARAAGFEHVSLDLIYGTPGETDADWEASLRAALGAGLDHLSAYGLTVEPGTRLHARVRAGTLPAPDDDAMARRYRIADALAADAGLRWYEISNWAADDRARCRHNLAYWRSQSWWGVGPGAHSHVGGVRWWNVLHPERHAERVRAGRSPAAGRERLTFAQQLLAGLTEKPEWTAVALVGLGHVAEADGDLDSAEFFHRRAWQTAPGHAAALEGLACVAGARGDAEAAARLLGAAAAWRQRRHRPADRIERADADRAEQNARTTLGDLGFDAAYRAGHAQPDLRLADADRVPAGR